MVVWREARRKHLGVQVKITENLEVETTFYELDSMVQPVLADIELMVED